MCPNEVDTFRVRRRNAAGARIKWLFDVTRAREKLGSVYPKPITADVLTEPAKAA